MENRRENKEPGNDFSQDYVLHTFGKRGPEGSSLDQISQKSNGIYYASDLNQPGIGENANLKYCNINSANSWQTKQGGNREPFSIINAKLARDSMTPKQDEESRDLSSKEVEIVEDADNSDACSAVDYSESECLSDSSTQMQNNNFISTDEVKIMLEQQNQRHLEIMKKQQEIFQMQINNHKQGIGSKIVPRSSLFQANHDWNGMNHSNANNHKSNSQIDKQNARPHSHSIIVESK